MGFFYLETIEYPGSGVNVSTPATSVELGCGRGGKLPKDGSRKRPLLVPFVLFKIVYRINNLRSHIPESTQFSFAESRKLVLGVTSSANQ